MEPSANEGLNTYQPPGKKRIVIKLDDVDEAILKSLKDLEKKRAQPQDMEEDHLASRLQLSLKDSTQGKNQWQSCIYNNF